MLILLLHINIMKPGNFLLVLILVCSVAVSAQPVWSPQVRAKKDAEWMHDSLHMTPAQMEKANPILLNYQQEMDQTGGSAVKSHELMKKKDAAMKSILNKEQYKKYYRREKQIRAIPKPNYKGPHQPY